MKAGNTDRHYLNTAVSSLLVGLLNVSLALLFSDEYARILVIAASLLAFVISAFNFYNYRRANKFRDKPGN